MALLKDALSEKQGRAGSRAREVLRDPFRGMSPADRKRVLKSLKKAYPEEEPEEKLRMVLRRTEALREERAADELRLERFAEAWRLALERVSN